MSHMKSSAAPSPSSIRVVTPARNVLGSLRLPGDKSISHRYAMLAGFAEGTSHLTNFSSGADPHSTLACVEQLGAQVERGENGAITITRMRGYISGTENGAGLRQLRLHHAYAGRPVGGATIFAARWWVTLR